MKHEHDNPFERFGIDPLDGPTAITERLRELAEDAPTAEERDAVRAAWEELTMHPARRLRAAFGAAPESRAPIGRPPRATAGAEAPLALVDLAPRPSIVDAVAARADRPALSPGLRAAEPRSAPDLSSSPGLRAAEPRSAPDPALPSFDDDPVVGSRARKAATSPKKTPNVL